MIRLQDLERISPYEWRIPADLRPDMRVPVRIFASRDLLEAVLNDKSLEQAVNVAALPGLVGEMLVMPDMHQGYGFPIGGVAATRYPDGVISPGGIGYDINCLTGDTRVLHAHGFTRQIADMSADWPGSRLTCFDLDALQPVAAQPVLWFGRPPKAPVLRLTTESGQSIAATADHPFWTPNGMQPADHLQPGDRIALYPFEGVPYEAPPTETIVSEADFSAFLRQNGKGASGNAHRQILKHLKTRGLLPLRYDAPALPYLLKLMGYLFGDGSLYFNSEGKGQLAFYGKAHDLESIRADVRQLGFTPSRVYSRPRDHTIQTTYRRYHFKHTEHFFRVSSTSLAMLLAFLGVPAGAKAVQDYTAPGWLDRAPRWQKRLFLAALFGAELSTPQTVSGHGTNFSSPTLSLNKRAGFEASGQQYLHTLAAWLETFGVETHSISIRAEQENADGSHSFRLRLSIRSDPENLIRLWSQIGYEYNRTRQALAMAAVQYLRHKLAHITARTAVEAQARQLAAAGHPTGDIVAALQGESVNRRFIERSLYEKRKSPPRVAADFPTFDEYLQSHRQGLGESGMVWDRIARIESEETPRRVYDFTINHKDHNFVANGFVVSNCGVRLLASDLHLEEARPWLDDLAAELYRTCPSGVGKGGMVQLSHRDLEAVLREGARWALKRGYASQQDLRRTEEGGALAGADPRHVSERAKKRGSGQLGSLGAGNHFLEVDVIEEIYDAEAADAMGLRPGHLAVQIHCGSRGLGHQVCTDYVQEFQGAIRRYGIRLPDRELVCAPLTSPEGQRYLAAMRAAANFAFANRQLLAWGARQAFERVFAGKTRGWELHQVYDIAHNIGKIEVHEVAGEKVKVCVHRKGATRAFGPGHPDLPEEYRAIGQPVIIPGSMGTGSWVLVGTEESMRRSFGSSCHGAGRTMSRARARKQVRGDALRRELEQAGIAVQAGSLRGLAEEAPRAYKDVDAVVQTVAQAGIARQVARLRPVAVIKG